MNFKFKEWLAQQQKPQAEEAQECAPGLKKTSKGCMKVLRTDPSSGMWIGIIDGKHAAVHPEEIDW